MFGSRCSIPAWCVDRGVNVNVNVNNCVHPLAPDRVYVGTLSPACLVLRPCMVAPPTDRV